MARYRSRRRRRRSAPLLLLTIGAVAVVWWVFPREAGEPDSETVAVRPSRPTLTTNRPDDPMEATPNPAVPERGDHPLTAERAKEAPIPNQTVEALIESGKKALANDDLVPARSYFSEALVASRDPAERTALRAELTRIGNETVFSGRIIPNDPHVERYVIQPGDSLGKIAKAYRVSDELLAKINGIRDKNRIRAGQAIKVIKGPFRAVVYADDYTLGIYLGDTFVKQFPVGLGEDGSTPRGTWKVLNKLVNPTYYPPRGGQIIAADDPENPLGERWIGLHGIEGEAVGQLRYGIHGTNEPDSIGKSVSLGCIRLHNEDVEVVYDCLVEEHSTVLVK